MVMVKEEVVDHPIKQQRSHSDDEWMRFQLRKRKRRMSICKTLVNPQDERMDGWTVVCPTSFLSP